MKRGGEKVNEIKAFIEDETAKTTVEVILIVVVLIALVVLFKGQITEVVGNILKKVSNQSNQV